MNQNDVIIDSASIVTNYFKKTTDSSSHKFWIAVNNVTDNVLNINNTLVIPCQSCLMVADTSRNYAYVSYYLVIIYENQLLPEVNVSMFLNNQNYSTLMTYAFSQLNPVNTVYDAGLALWTDHVYTEPPGIDITSTYTLTSSTGNFYLGKLDAHKNTNMWNCAELPGSFYYENNTLSGMVDDTPDLVVDSTDALVNIKSMLPMNCSNFNLTTAGNFFGDVNFRLGFFLAYTTPCPARSLDDTFTTYTICEGQSVTLGTQSTGNTYTWYPKVNLNDSAIVNPVASPTTTTNYFVLIDSAGCKHTEQVRVYVTPAPKADTITSINSVCGGTLGSVSAGQTHSVYQPLAYSLNGGNYQTTNVFNGLTDGAYSVTIKDNLGCTWQTDTVTITEINPANLNATVSPDSGKSPLLIILDATSSTGVNHYNWYFNSMLNSTSNFYNATLTDTGLYQITLIGYYNQPQCADTMSFIVLVTPEDTSGVFVPNVFSPNNDNINDVFTVKLHNVSVEAFEVYNRYGTLLFNPDVKNQTSEITWDGHTTAGEPCSDGTYFFVLVYTDNKKEKHERTGFVMLVR